MIIRLISQTTIDLSYFENLSKNSIDWGDGNVTTDTYTHTYLNPGVYYINADFSNVSKIKDNFNIQNSNYISFDYIDNELLIGNNFLSGNATIKFLNMSNLNVISIGTNFLENTTNLKCLKLPYKEGVTLGSFGNNFMPNGGKIFCGLYSDYYKNANIWKDKKNMMYDQESVFKNVDLDRLKSSYNNFKFYESDTEIDLLKYPVLKSLFDNGTLKCVDNMIYDEYSSDSTPRQVWSSKKEINKTYFVLTFIYNFKLTPEDNDNITKYKYQILYRALSRNGNILNVKSYKNDTYYILDENFNETNKFDIKKEYYANSLIINSNPQYYFQKNFYELEPYHELEDPNYAMGRLQFGLIDDSNITYLEYDGDHETGFTIKIRVNGACKNIKIWSNKYNDKLKRKPYIFIKTDKIGDGMLKSGDYIEINTRVGKKSASFTRNGVKENILKYISEDSTWLSLKHGTNELFCTADTDIGSILNCNINAIYNDLYEGI